MKANVDANSLPQFFPAAWEQEYGVFGIRFTDDVSIGFVQRGPGGYSYLQSSDFDELQVNSMSLLADALIRLSELNEHVELKIAKPFGATLIWIAAEDNFIAIRFLSPSVQEIIRDEVGDDFLFVIPCRDDVIVWNADAPLDTTLSKAREAKDEYEDDDYLLSPHVYRFSNAWPCERVKLRV